MKIEFEKSKKIIHFADLDIGTIFRDPSYDTVYMKTEYIYNDGDEINSIDLATGNLGGFSDDAKVYPVNVTLYVKE